MPIITGSTPFTMFFPMDVLIYSREGDLPVLPTSAHGFSAAPFPPAQGTSSATPSLGTGPFHLHIPSQPVLQRSQPLPPSLVETVTHTPQDLLGPLSPGSDTPH